MALAGPYPYVEPRDLLERPGPLVCLDGAQDPRNLGAIARTAEAVGAAGIAIPRRGSPGVTPVVVKASAGATEHLAIAQVGSMTAFVHDARAGGERPAVGAEPEGGEDYRAVPWRRDAILVMGAEGAGLRPAVRGRLRPPGPHPDGRPGGVAEHLRGRGDPALRDISHNELTQFAYMSR